MRRTFIDAGVLIYGARGQGILSEKALEILADPEREFAPAYFP